MAWVEALAADWPELNQLLDEALSLPEAQRASWLRALPPQHAPLRDTLARLLDVRAAIETDDFLHVLPRLDAGAPPGAAVAQPGAGTLVGPWRLLRELGEGGMGSVWLAERADGSLKRQVALKLPRLAWERNLAERMLRERDILATLEHPHIARLYDAGVDEIGRPWLALEYVQGQAIDAYCSDRALGVPERLHLLLQVCEAVAYAHSRLVIHRDLKPANVVVTDDGRVKLLDFGIAKLALDGPAEATALTQQAGRAMSLRWASPEQVGGEALTTASDVYSLGVLAFELLTGASPYELRRGSSAELEEAICSAEPRRASAAAADPVTRRALRGDLDAILGKALEKVPAQRYATVDALAEDVRRHVRQEAVLARPHTGWYRAQRLVRRRPLESAVVAGVVLAALGGAHAQAAVAVALGAGVVVGIWQYRRARAAAEQAAVERDHARREAQRAEAARDFMLDLFMAGGSRESPEARETTATELLQRGVDRIDRLAGSGPDTQAFLLTAFSHVYTLLGRNEEALALQVRSLEAATRAYGAQAPETLSVLAGIADRLWRLGRVDECTRTVEEALARIERHAPRTAAHASVLVTHMRIWFSRDPARTIASGRLAVSFIDDMRMKGDEKAQARLYLARAYKNAGRLGEAREMLEQARPRFLEIGSEDSADMAFLLQTEVSVYFGLGQWARAADSGRRAIAVFSKFPELRRSANPATRILLARALRAGGQREEADAELHLALQERDLEPGRYPSVQLIELELCTGRLLAGGGDVEERLRLLVADPVSGEDVRLVARGRLAVLAGRAGRLDEARQLVDEAEQALRSQPLLLRALNVADAAAQCAARHGDAAGIERALQGLQSMLPETNEGQAVASEVALIEARAWDLLGRPDRVQARLATWLPALRAGAEGVAAHVAAEMLVLLAAAEDDGGRRRERAALSLPWLDRSQLPDSPLRLRGQALAGADAPAVRAPPQPPC